LGNLPLPTDCKARMRERRNEPLLSDMRRLESICEIPAGDRNRDGLPRINIRIRKSYTGLIPRLFLTQG
jgi:hypothetical protein